MESRKIATAVLAAVSSSQISAIGFTASTEEGQPGTCTIAFPAKGEAPAGVYQYPMSPEKFAEFQAADSKGKFFGAEIRAKVSEHPHTKLTQDEVSEFIMRPVRETNNVITADVIRPEVIGGVNVADTLQTGIEAERQAA